MSSLLWFVCLVTTSDNTLHHKALFKNILNMVPLHKIQWYFKEKFKMWIQMKKNKKIKGGEQGTEVCDRNNEKHKYCC